MKKLYLVMGRTASGKSSLTKEVAKKLNMTVLKSYTTRPMREDDKKNADHIFIKTEDVSKYKEHIAAYTKICEYEYFSTKEQLLSSDFYIIDPIGYYNLLEYINDNNLEIQPVIIFITIPRMLMKKMAEARKDDLCVFEKRLKAEDTQFNTFCQTNMIDYRILNDRSFEEAVEKFIKIIRKDISKSKEGEK